MTFAPKWDISIASSYVIRGIENAFSTFRGSAVITPSTSDQISISRASSAAPNIEAVRSEPPRPIVTVSLSVVEAMNPQAHCSPRCFWKYCLIRCEVRSYLSFPAPNVSSVLISVRLSIYPQGTPEAFSASAIMDVESISPKLIV